MAGSEHFKIQQFDWRALIIGKMTLPLPLHFAVLLFVVQEKEDYEMFFKEGDWCSLRLIISWYDI